MLYTESTREYFEGAVKAVNLSTNVTFGESSSHQRSCGVSARLKNTTSSQTRSVCTCCLSGTKSNVRSRWSDCDPRRGHTNIFYPAPEVCVLMFYYFFTSLPFLITPYFFQRSMNRWISPSCSPRRPATARSCCCPCRGVSSSVWLLIVWSKMTLQWLWRQR